jgi:hypothetical protein
MPSLCLFYGLRRKLEIEAGKAGGSRAPEARLHQVRVLNQCLEAADKSFAASCERAAHDLASNQQL